MLKKTLLAAAVSAAVNAGGALAADAAPAPSPHTFTANVGLFSQYIFRGLTQTNEDPAIQGGFDYAYNFGPASFYVGNWNSNISWLTDGGQYSSSSLESDIYAGVKGNFGESDFSWDVGVLQYLYPGNVLNAAPGGFGGAKGDTTEVYGALGWKWLSFKASYVVSNKAFAVQDAQGTYYLDLSAAYPVGDTGLTLIAHAGQQKYDGSDARNVVVGGARLSNDDQYSYYDYKLGFSYDLGKLTDVLKSTTAGFYYTNTSSANGFGYNGRGDSPAGAYPKEISGEHYTFFLQKTF
jgi:uncharacterized protein (TIGR02001 family)